MQQLMLELKLSKTDERRWRRIAKYWGSDLDLLFASVIDDIWRACGKDVIAQERLQKHLAGKVKRTRASLGECVDPVGGKSGSNRGEHQDEMC